MNKFRNLSGVKAFSSMGPLLLLVASAVLTACGGGGGGGSTVTPASKPPTATSSAVLTAEDTATTASLKASDPDGDPLIFRIARNGNLGTAVVTDPANGTFVYTPDPDKNGTDSFTFQVNDGTTDSNSATVTITITPVGGDAPVAQDSSLSTDEDTVSSGILTATDPDGDAVTYSLVSNAAHGNVTVTDAVSGSFTYVPEANWDGSDSFTFKANDGQLDSNIATVTLNVNPVNDAPVAVEGCSHTPQPPTAGALAAYSGTLQASDLDSTSLTYSLPDGSFGPVFTAKGGEVTITNPTTGAFTYKPKALADGGVRGIDTFNYRVTDSDNATTTGTETVIVNQTIMPLGDSITVGDNAGVPTSTFTTVGYRKPLFDNLVASGYDFDFVGTQNHGTSFAGFDYNHQGHGGWTASEIAWGGGPGSDPNDPNDGVFGWLNANPSDFILLHAGTNALDPNGDIDIAAILDEIDRWEISPGANHVTVLLALIIDQTPINPDVTTFNNNVLSMANDRINNQGDDIVIVDQHTAAGLVYQIGTDMADKWHPNAGGYAKMANLWFSELSNVLDTCP